MLNLTCLKWILDKIRSDNLVSIRQLIPKKDFLITYFFLLGGRTLNISMYDF